MKRSIFVFLLSLSASVVLAQFKVTPDGKIAIGIGNQTPISRLAVGNVGNQSSNFFFEGDGVYSMRVRSIGTVSSEAIWGSVDVFSNSCDNGVRGSAVSATPLSYGKAAGLFGQAGNAKTGFNYGVYGVLHGENFGAAVFGDVSNSYWYWDIDDGKYAGYFKGNVKVTGTLNATVTGNSDIRFKQNITELGSNDKGSRDVLNQITNLVPISYNYKQVYKSIGDSIGMFDEESILFKKKHFGLIAQDLQKIYPDLVYENDNGYLSVNYTEIIPLLIQSIKELKEEVDLLSSALVGTRSATSSDMINDLPKAILYQNAPNPFSERTEIKFELPDNSRNAFIYIFNMQGTLVKQISISSMQRSVLINGSELTAGMYMYSLIVDGKEIDTKKMILTK